MRHELAEFGVATTRLFGDANLSVDDFKSLAVVWLKKILDTHAGMHAYFVRVVKLLGSLLMLDVSGGAVYMYESFA